MSETDENELTYEAIDIPTDVRARARRNPACRHDVRRVLCRGAPGGRQSGHGGRGAGGHYAGRVARLYATEGKYTDKDALVAIESAFAAHLGAPVAQKTPRKAEAH
jgi:hypothetical protein